jgi:hypothetical protein
MGPSALCSAWADAPGADDALPPADVAFPRSAVVRGRTPGD